MIDLRDFWSATDFTYACLRDRERSATLGAVTAATVRPGDVVLDAGAGTGILSLYAARAGAARVYAVEVDPVLCRHLRRTVARNGYDDIITVVEEDVHTLALPPVDVALMELIETGLVEESLVSAYNALLGHGTVTARTRCLPAGYATFLQPVRTDDSIDGFEVVALRHEWSYYDRDAEAWNSSTWTATGPPEAIWSATLSGEPLPPEVVVRLEVPDPTTNGLRLTGVMAMPDGRSSTDFPTLNGPKIIPIPEHPAGAERLEVRYLMSGGFGRFVTTWLPEAPAPGPALLAGG